MRNYIFIFFLISTAALTAQFPSGTAANATSQSLEQLGLVYFNSRVHGAEQVEGSQHLDETYKPATISGITQTHLVRFNAYTSQIEVRMDGGATAALPPGREFLVDLQDGSGRAYVTRKIPTDDGAPEECFLERIAEGERYRLYERPRIRYMPEEPAKGYSPHKPARFEAAPSQFYLESFEDGKFLLRQLPRRKKDFIAFFADDTYVKTYLKDQKPDLGSKSDLAAFMQAYFSKL